MWDTLYFYFSSHVLMDKHFSERSLSVPPSSQYLTKTSNVTFENFTDFDYKVIDYMNKLERQDTVKTYVSEARNRYKSEEPG